METDLGTDWDEDALLTIEASFGGAVDVVDLGASDCDALVFARPPSHRIGADVAVEIDAADRIGLPIYALGRRTMMLDRTYPRPDMLAWDYLTDEQTRAESARLRGAVAA